MKETILNLIKSNNDKLSFKQICKKTNIDEILAKQLLSELELEGSVLKTDNKYMIFPENHYISSISLTKNINKVIFYDGKIYPVATRYLDSVILNDTVSFTINERQEAIIKSIIDRKLHNITCIIRDTGKKKIVESFHKGIKVELEEEILNNLKDGDIILVNIGLNNVESSNYQATFKNVIGNVSEPNIDEITIAANYGFDNYYSEEYLEELNQIPTEVTELDCINRLDLRHLDFITIDGIDAKDMDDAVYVEKTPIGYRVYVSISDVSHYVKYGTEIYKRAYEKGTSYYANNIVFHMLHNILSNGICSLNPNVDRLTKTVIMDITPTGNIINSEIKKTVIRSRIKTNYDDVDKLFINNECIDSYKPYENLLKNLYEITTILETKAKNKDGKLDFPSDEVNKTYDEFGNVLTVSQAERTPSKKSIEYLMIAANQSVASYIYWQQIPSIYRIHDIPDLRKTIFLI